MPDMSDDNGTYPYALAVLPCEKPAGHFQWVICKHGKLVERSDRAHPSERSARERGQAALERQFRRDQYKCPAQRAHWRGPLQNRIGLTLMNEGLRAVWLQIETDPRPVAHAR